jgi:hypothetical protein
MVGTFVTGPRDAGCLSKVRGPHRRSNTISFCTQHYSINAANLPNSGSKNTNYFEGSAKAMYKTLHIGNGCLQSYDRENNTALVNIRFVQE